MDVERKYSDIEFSDDSVLIYQPRFTDDTKARIRAIVRLPNGQLKEMEVNRADQASSIVRDIFLQYTEAEIMDFSMREVAVLTKKTVVDEKVVERQTREQEMAVTFQAKVKALEMPEVVAFPDKRVVRRIRKAKSPFEVAALVAYVLQKSFESEDQEQHVE